MYNVCKKAFVSLVICFILICNLFTPSTIHIRAAEPSDFIPADMITFKVIKGDVIFTLRNISTEEYMWEIKPNRDGIVKYEKLYLDSYVDAYDSRSTVYRFTGTDRGFVDVKFTYLRSWKPGKILYEDTYRISVSGPGNIISVFSLSDNHAIHATIHDGLCTFAIPGEANTNFGWDLEIKPKDIIEMTWRQFMSYPVGHSYDCMYYYTCQGIQPGKVILRFTHRQSSFDVYKPYTEYFKLIVAKNMQITYADYVSQLNREA